MTNTVTVTKSTKTEMCGVLWCPKRGIYALKSPYNVGFHSCPEHLKRFMKIWLEELEE